MSGHKYEIIEFDRDYRTVTRRTEMEFASDSEADAYCDEKSWTGYDYHAKRLQQPQVMK